MLEQPSTSTPVAKPSLERAQSHDSGSHGQSQVPGCSHWSQDTAVQIHELNRMYMQTDDHVTSGDQSEEILAASGTKEVLHDEPIVAMPSYSQVRLLWQ